MAKQVTVRFVRDSVKKHSVRYNQSGEENLEGHMSVYVTSAVLEKMGGDPPAEIEITFSAEE